MYYILSFLLWVACLGAQEAQLLKESDIHRIMEEIFQQHVDKKEISLSIFRLATKNFLQQADPDNLYLTDEETRPYISLANDEVEKLIQQYKKGDYSYFVKMNNLIQNAFLRARTLREDLAESFPLWIEEVASQTRSYPDRWQEAAKSPQELEQRMEFAFKAYALDWIHHFGKARALTSKKELIQKFNEELADKEDLYLYLAPDGKPLFDAEKENLLSLHILKALAAALDSHTKVYNPKEALDMRIRLEKGYEGVGMVLEQGQEGLRVAELIAGSPAALSQLILVGDEIIAVNGVSLRHLELQEGLRTIREIPGDDVTLTLLRQNQESKKLLEIPLKKGHVLVDMGRVKVDKFAMGNGVIGVIKLDAFYHGQEGISSENDVKNAIDRLDEENLRGLILDLRDNSGGFLTEAVKVVGLFISNGVVVISKYASGEEKIYRDLDGKAEYKGPLIVLVSKMTASAAEIVAQALQDYGVALVVGDDHTYGKGTIQSQTVTKDKSASSYFKVTVGKYYTVSGKTPQLQGVIADIVVPGPLESQEIGEAFLGGTLSQDTIPSTYKDNLSDIDPQQRAWYLKYYTPSIQPREQIWKSFVPNLQQKSAFRIAHNLDYQNFLKTPQAAFPPDRDFQLQETVNIMRDIIYQETKRARDKKD